MNLTVPLLRFVIDTLYGEAESIRDEYLKNTYLDAADSLSDLVDEITGANG